MSDPARASRTRLCAAASVLALTAATPALPETRPTLNFYGATGLIDMPSGEAQPDAALTTSSAHFGANSRTTLSFQIAPRISASFRFLGIRNWSDNPPVNDTFFPFDIYYDRSFDLRFKVLDESRYLPAVTVGFQDYVGTGILSGEYIAATKHVLPNVKVTAGLGWGRLGSNGGTGSPFGERPPIDIGEGGNVNAGQWFRGPVAPFGGVEWQVNDKWGLKAEYSSDDYTIESGQRGTFEKKSPFNFGVEYQASDALRIGGYYLYGSELGISAHFTVNPKARKGGIVDSAPSPVKVRPSRASDPDAWSQEWVTQDGANPLLRENIAKLVESDGILIEALGYTGQMAQVRIRNVRYDAEAQAIGRVARAMSRSLPASVEVFEIVPVVNGMPTSRVILRRTDIEALEFAPDGATALLSRAKIEGPGLPVQGLTYDKDLYPRFVWSLGPYNRLRLFDQTDPLKADVGLRLTGRYEITPGLILSGSLTKKIAGNLDEPPPDIVTGLQPVRSDVDLYDANADPSLDSLTMAFYTTLGHDLYGRVTAGYLERMFGGVSAEVLWKPVDRRWAIGAEVAYVAQRDTDGQLGFGEYDYRVATGHVSGYVDLGKGFHAQVDVGRYLAGDVGATLSLDREFANGWKVGAFATKTNVSAEDFGSGSFDKGIRIEIPFTTLAGTPTRRSVSTVLRPFGRDGGARLDVDGRLYETVRDYHASDLDAQWGRFWK